jgi:hypothetical protein
VRRVRLRGILGREASNIWAAFAATPPPVLGLAVGSRALLREITEFYCG